MPVSSRCILRTVHYGVWRGPVYGAVDFERFIADGCIANKLFLLERPVTVPANAELRDCVVGMPPDWPSDKAIVWNQGTISRVILSHVES